jgi:hypothetical protein
MLRDGDVTVFGPHVAVEICLPSAVLTHRVSRPRARSLTGDGDTVRPNALAVFRFIKEIDGTPALWGFPERWSIKSRGAY